MLMLSGCADSSSSKPNGQPATDTSLTSAPDRTGFVTESPQTVASDTSDTSAEVSDSEKPKPKGYVAVAGINHVTSEDKLNEYLCELEELAAPYGYGTGFTYENLVTGAKLQYNSYKQFLTASTIKAPYVKYLLESGADLDEMLVAHTVWDDGDAAIGQLVPSDQGKSFSVRTLIEKTVVLSDNSAYYTLVQHFGVDGFNAMQQRIGVSSLISLDDIFPSASAVEQCKSYKDIYKFAEENENGKALISQLSRCETNVQIGKALGGKYTVAQKYGAEYDEEPMTYNDCAVCYAEKPFVLCILTEQEPETPEANEYFQKVAVIIDKINELIID